MIVEKVAAGDGAFGFNAANEQYEDLVAAGVIDPAKVTFGHFVNSSLTITVITVIVMTMVGKLQKEIRQTKPFESLGQEAFLNLQRTSDFLQRRVADQLRPYGITPPQFNVLRILRGAGDKGLITREIGERMITAVPDVTRMIDRIEALGLISRERGLADRRLVTVCIADSGLKLLSELDVVFKDFHNVLFGVCSEQEITGLIEVLEKLRSDKLKKR